MPEKPNSLQDIFENMKAKGLIKFLGNYSEWQAQGEQEDIERGKFEPEQAKNPQKKSLADLMEEEGGWFDGPEDKKRFEFIMPD